METKYCVTIRTFPLCRRNRKMLELSSPTKNFLLETFKYRKLRLAFQVKRCVFIFSNIYFQPDICFTLLRLIKNWSHFMSPTITSCSGFLFNQNTTIATTIKKISHINRITTKIYAFLQWKHSKCNNAGQNWSRNLNCSFSIYTLLSFLHRAFESLCVVRVCLSDNLLTSSSINKLP